jgi:hypothetical protein
MNDAATTAADPSPANAAVPLCVKLHGPIIVSSVFIEAVMRYAKRDWRCLLRALRGLLSNRAALRTELLTDATRVDTLAYNTAGVAWLQSERSRDGHWPSQRTTIQRSHRVAGHPAF